MIKYKLTLKFFFSVSQQLFGEEKSYEGGRRPPEKNCQSNQFEWEKNTSTVRVLWRNLYFCTEITSVMIWNESWRAGTESKELRRWP